MDDPELRMQLDRFRTCVLERDRPTAERVLDEEFALVLVHPEPVMMARARWLEVLADYVVLDWMIEEDHLDVDRDGVAAHLQRVWMQATVLGEDRSGPFVISDVWRLRADGWRVWRRHSSPLFAGPMPGRDRDR